MYLRVLTFNFKYQPVLYFLMRKGQMGAFLMIGFVMFVMVIFFFAGVTSLRRNALQNEADDMKESLLDSQTITNYIQACVSQVSRDAFQEISLSGGFFYNATGRNITIMDNQIPFLEYYDTDTSKRRNAAYLVIRGADDYDPFYPCSLFSESCNGRGTSLGVDPEPGVHFCGFSLDHPDNYSSCEFGDRQPLSLEIFNVSIQKQLENKIALDLPQCLNMSFFKEEMNFQSPEIEAREIESKVLFGDRRITFSVDIPLVITLSEVESLALTKVDYSYPLDFGSLFKNIFQGEFNTLILENTKLNHSLKNYMQDQILLNGLDYTVEQRFNEKVQDDIYKIKHNSMRINDEPYQFVFAVENRLPALSFIDYAPKNDSCEVLVPPGTNVTIEPKAVDPDEEDELEFFFKYPSTTSGDDWNISKESISKVVTESDDGSIVNVVVNDGQYNDSQDVRICVDSSTDIIYEPKIEFYHPYEGFSKTRMIGGYEHTIITLEDPLKLRVGEGFSPSGVWDICGNGVISTNNNCVIFPTGQPCSEEPNFNITNIKTMIDTRFALTPGKCEVTYTPDGSTPIKINVSVEECVPHRNSDRSDDPFMKEHYCCMNDGDDYSYAGTSHKVRPQEILMCGNPTNLVLSDPSANDIFDVTRSYFCYADRGNTYDNSSVVYTDITKSQEVSDQSYPRCLGCGNFLESTSNQILTYDYDDKDDDLATFEDQDLDAYICNPASVCLPASGRGQYDETSTPGADNILRCRGGCNSGECNYAVECICDQSCSSLVSSGCHEKAPGEPLDPISCTNGGIFDKPYLQDVCSNSCKASDVKDNEFTCIPGTDCDNCDPMCNGKTAFETVQGCTAENPAVMDMCDSEGQLVDAVQYGKKVCMYQPALDCTQSSPECHGEEVDSVLSGEYLYGSDLYADKCSSSCRKTDSDVCVYVEELDNDPDAKTSSRACDRKRSGSVLDFFDIDGVADAYCTNFCEPVFCGEGKVAIESDECFNNPSDENCCVSD